MIYRAWLVVWAGFEWSLTAAVVGCWGGCYTKVYLGGYSIEEHAARTYDRAAIKFWGVTTTLNFPVREGVWRGYRGGLEGIYRSSLDA
eukprot:580343-Prorocentrum_minimum.AAC.1